MRRSRVTTRPTYREGPNRDLVAGVRGAGRHGGRGAGRGGRGGGGGDSAGGVGVDEDGDPGARAGGRHSGVGGGGRRRSGAGRGPVGGASVDLAVNRAACGPFPRGDLHLHTPSALRAIAGRLEFARRPTGGVVADRGLVAATVAEHPGTGDVVHAP